MFERLKTKPNQWIEIYFTPSTACEDNIIEEISHAKKIDAAVYAINNDKIVNALIEAKNEGLRLRILTDRLQSKGRGSLVPKLQKMPE